MQEPGNGESSRFDRVRFGLYRRTGFNLRKRQSLHRTVGYGTEAVTRRVRAAIGRDQHLTIHGHDLVLPPDHRLPYYQRRDPNYDVYAADVLAAIASQADVCRVLDVGANVGDTALMALTAADNIEVTSVEGNPSFAGYARRNLAPFGPRADVREAFVGPVHGVVASYASHGGTGGFQRTSDGTSSPGSVDWLSPQALIDDLGAADVVIWKSDIDGFDIHLLVEYWEPIAAACEVIWFEYDPLETLGDPADVSILIETIGADDRGMLVFDNVGNRMLSAAPGGDAARALRDLTGWLYAQREHNMTTRYFDVWLVSERLWPSLETTRVPSNPTAPVDGADSAA